MYHQTVTFILSALAMTSPPRNHILFLAMIVILFSCQERHAPKGAATLSSAPNQPNDSFRPYQQPARSLPTRTDSVTILLQHLLFHTNDTLLFIDKQPIHTIPTLAIFYRKNQYRPVWIDNEGFNRLGIALIDAIKKATDNGLHPDDYHYHKIYQWHQYFLEQQRKRILPETTALLSGELLLTDAFFLYASHLLHGKTDPETIDPQWKAERADCPIELDDYLIETLNTGEIAQSLSKLEPNHEAYQLMKQALKKYVHIASQGGWPQIDFDQLKKLQLNDSSDIIPLIKQRLLITNEYTDTTSIHQTVFDSTLWKAVKLFQKRHGLDADGVIGKATTAAMNATVQDHIETLLINMERMRWLPRNTDQSRYIIVNIAAFYMKVIDKGQPIIQSKAIVGRTYRMTPVFSAKMTHMITNPSWTVPKTILREDVIPAIKKDINYLRKKKMRILDYQGNEIDPHTIDWSRVNPRNFPYIIRQDPGKHNSLGSIKFMFPNKYDVYMHDTPDKQLFEKELRAYSSGCIRIQEYLKLAAYLLRSKQVTEDSIQRLLDSGRQLQINLPEPIMVHVVYLTADVNNGELVFRKDIYGRDKALKAALYSKYISDTKKH